MKTPLRLARERRGMSLFEVAMCTGINQANISRIERGRQVPSTQIAATLAQLFGPEITELHIYYPERYADQAAALGG